MRLALSIVGLLIIVLASWLVWHLFAVQQSLITSPVSVTTAMGTGGVSLPIRDQSGNMHYNDAEFHFTIEYPYELGVVTVSQLQEGGQLIDFTNQSDKQFQIYATAYAEKSITQDRFKLDEPSGVVQNPTQVSIDGEQAEMFFGQNDRGEATREVWFIHNGFLYEVRTSKNLDTWLSGIMASWKFI